MGWKFLKEERKKRLFNKISLGFCEQDLKKGTQPRKFGLQMEG